MPTVKVNLKDRSYPVTIGSGLTDKLVSQLRKHLSGGRVFVFYDAGFYALHGVKLSKSLSVLGSKTEFVVPSGEKSKSQAMFNKIQDFLFSEKISRDDFILACGGGVTSDLIGFVAATTLRGVRWGVVPTTLLGMVDAAIGGKTGINHRSGKNLIGAFWQPSFVICDTGYLMTLPSREMTAGLGEVAKYAGLIGHSVIELLNRLLNKSSLYDENLLRRLITMSAAYKAQIVASDELDRGSRMYLNLGHTVGHAIENALGYGRLRHGEAVCLGLLATLNLSAGVGKKRSSKTEEYRSVIERMVSFVPYKRIEQEAVMEAITIDKKRSGSNLRLVLLEQPGKPVISSSVTIAQLRRATSMMLDYYKAFGGKNA